MHYFSLVITLAAWIFTTAADPSPNPIPQIFSDLPPGSDGNNDGEVNISKMSLEDFYERLEDLIIILVDDKPLPLNVPPVGSRVFAELTSVMTVKEARVVSAPAGVGCFFMSKPEIQSSPRTSNPSSRRKKPSGFSKSSKSSRSSSRSSFRSSNFHQAGGESAQNTYVTPTFYSSGLEKDGETLVLDPSFVNAGYISCFRLPVNDQQEIDENTVAFLIDFKSPNGEAIIVPGLEGLGSEITHFDSMQLNALDDSVKKAGLGFGHTEVAITRAAIVHAPPAMASEATCRIIALIADEHLRFADFSIARQLEKPIPDVRFLVCQNSSDFDMGPLTESAFQF